MENQLQLNEDGSIRSLSFSGEQIAFREDEHRGFRFYTVVNGKKEYVQLLENPKNKHMFFGSHQGLDFELKYQMTNIGLEVLITVKNITGVSYRPTTLGVKLGIDSFMEKYPEWKERYFPTLLRCEKMYFWGYQMTPSGKILAITCEEPIAAWSLDYNCLEHEDEGDINLLYLNGGHRIYTSNLHLINCAPVPKRHPQMEEILPYGEIRRTIRLTPVKTIEELPKMFASLCDAPAIYLNRYTAEPGQLFTGKIYSKSPIRKINVTGPDGVKICENAIQVGEVYEFRLQGLTMPGIYQLEILDEKGKMSEASVFVKKTDCWYLEKGRDAVLQSPPVPTHHMESFQSLYTLLLAEKYLPDEEKDKIGSRIFTDLMGKLYDESKGRAMEATESRIQDTASMAYLMALRYEASGEINWLKKASKLADNLMERQGKDGAYYCKRSEEKETHYTAVTYLAKYMMDVAYVEQKTEDVDMRQASVRHLDSAYKAIMDLQRRKDNIETEGEMTFEDGMISCSLLQLAYQALNSKNLQERSSLIESAEILYSQHRCLTQLLIPDCRMNGATLRFWEAQYNVHIFHNAMNSPCGWTSWKLYGTWYLYLLTGKAHYLRETMNGLDACLQLVDTDTGVLRWGFLCDPYIETKRYVQRNPGEMRGKLTDDVISEQYVDMVTPWHRIERFPRAKWGIDQLVHEIFKCLAEISLTNGYVLQEEDESYTCYHCKAESSSRGLIVVPSERSVSSIHVNLGKEDIVIVEFGDKISTDHIKFGWIGKRGDELYGKA